MSEEIKNFINDLITVFQEKYNNSLKEKDNEAEKDREFRLGCNFAYFDILDVIELQLKSFGLKDDISYQIVPVLGQEINKEK